jgi:hypothetical protein
MLRKAPPWVRVLVFALSPVPLADELASRTAGMTTVALFIAGLVHAQMESPFVDRPLIRPTLFLGAHQA